jgi:hypothetical protein
LVVGLSDAVNATVRVDDLAMACES